MGKKLCSFFLLFLLCFSFVASFFSLDCSASVNFGNSSGSITGYSTVDSTSLIGSAFTSPSTASGATLTSIVWYGYADSTANVKAVLVLLSTKNIVAVSNVVSVDATPQWHTNSFSVPPSLAASTGYIFMIISDAAVNLASIAGGTNVYADYSNSYVSPSNPTAASVFSGACLIYGITSIPELSLSSNPEINATITIDSVGYVTPQASLASAIGNHTFAAEPSKVFGAHAYTFDHWVVNGSTSYTVNPLTLNISASTTLAAFYIEYSGVFQFYGPYDELTGLLLNENVTVTAHYAESTGIPDYSFVLNGTWVYPPDYNVQYFEYLFSDNSTRQYWLDPSEIITSLYVLKGNDTTGYVINFLDYTGVLLTYPFVTIKAYVNGSLFTVEKLKVDEQNSIGAYLINGEKYQLVIGNEAYNFVYGDLLMTSSNGVQLILRGVNFPKETLLMYKNVVLYALRDFSSSSISFYYNDAKNLTNSVTVTFTDSDGVVAYSNSFVANSINLNWTGAVNSTSYQLDVIVNHEEYGEFTWSQYFVNVAGEGAAMFDFSFLGNWSFDLTYLFPAILILFAAACFSALNAEVGALLSVIVAVFLTWMGWIPIPVGSLVAGLAFAILMALVYNKRRVGIY
jgi:hypothetical protein